MKQKIFLFLFIISVLFFAQNTKALTVSTAQQIEILKQEILVLQSLIENYNLYQEPSAGSYIAVDISNNSVLLQKNANTQFSMASVTKLMTAVISLENINTNQEITLTEEMLLPLGQTPVFYPGLKITALNLLKATMIQSSNDSAEALSYFLGKENFISLMNQKAKELGMSNTIYYDTHGLNLNNKSTASDLTKLMSYVYKNHPQILEITKTNDFWLSDQNSKMLKFKNVNNFYYIAEFVGGKTGYLTEAKQTFNSVFNVNGKPVAIAVLYSNNRMADIFSILRQLK
jgi:D-alanyl-D-alanine carboxypeptidase (penicillin-binding protein 5/6)